MSRQVSSEGSGDREEKSVTKVYSTLRDEFIFRTKAQILWPKKWPTWCHCHPPIKHTRVEGARWLLFRKDIVKKAGQGGAVSLIEGGNHRIRKSNQACEDPVIMCLKLEWWADALGFPGTRGNFSLLLGASANCLRNKWMRRGWRSKSQEVAGRSWLSVSHINQMWLTCFP